jgi:hypothetical protein
VSPGRPPKTTAERQANPAEQSPPEPDHHGRSALCTVKMGRASATVAAQLLYSGSL